MSWKNSYHASLQFTFIIKLVMVSTNLSQLATLCKLYSNNLPLCKVIPSRSSKNAEGQCDKPRSCRSLRNVSTSLMHRSNKTQEAINTTHSICSTDVEPVRSTKSSRYSIILFGRATLSTR